ncbi:MAG TPA: ABC transporter permease [Chloroflexota bacterium]|nr:ABC transporter permease [Chloroflexota bacterium]
MQEPDIEVTGALSDQAPWPMSAAHADAVILDETEDQVVAEPIGQWTLVWRRFIRHRIALIGGVMLILLILMAIFGPLLSPESPLSFNYFAGNKAPELNWRYLMGTDAQGHAIIMYILYGARISLEVGVFATVLTSIIGVLVGSIGGFFGGWVDAVMMRLTDVFLTLPFLPLLILLSAYTGGGNITFVILILGLLSWSPTARLVRSYFLSLRSQEFVQAAQALGVSSPRIMFKHMLPNALSVVIVSSTLNVAGFIIAEAAIDFLGVGIHTPNVSWGLALANSESYIADGNWWWPLFPGLALLITVLSVNFLGDGLRDALDVRAKVE